MHKFKRRRLVSQILKHRDLDDAAAALFGPQTGPDDEERYLQHFDSLFALITAEHERCVVEGLPKRRRRIQRVLGINFDPSYTHAEWRYLESAAGR